MDIDLLARQFGTIGARLKVEEWNTRRTLSASQPFTLDIGGDRRGELFVLKLSPGAADGLDLTATDIRPHQRHLLLLDRTLTQASGEKRKFLCGHDERHWFVANVPNSRGVASVTEAMEALKPAVVIGAQRRSGVRAKDWHNRHNAGFIRQGEWFFLPRPNFEPSHSFMILRDEPIRRGGGKPHMVEELYRDGGVQVYVHRNYPNGLTQSQYEALLARKPKASSWDWRPMRRNPSVHARGRIRHPDHATIILPCWHQVVMSAESQGGSVVFLD
ncbi:hypothetical protein CCAX7_009890 [Capsulimonas corticalis]|uniref:Uncharacterized protein n=1 Tax=Capsulimonas corticalis TaxID=2219043 RepID=A0A402CUC3_9BACT|nr:hypothetical protein [Capsulimonas corticalis]BDI28938.1 hypothetical protein CCAX7_009890 [Capsulimonas corticalis]